MQNASHIHLPNGAIPLLLLNDYAATLRMDSENLELEAKMLMSAHDMRQVRAKTTDPKSKLLKKFNIILYRPWAPPHNTLTFYHDTARHTFHRHRVSARTRPGGGEHHHQFSLKVSFASNLNRFEYEQSISNLQKFDPNRSQFIDDPAVCLIWTGLVNSLGGEKLGLRLATDVRRRHAGFGVKIGGRKMAYLEPAMDSKCGFHCFFNPYAKPWTHISGAQITPHEIKEILDERRAPFLGNVPHLELEYKPEKSIGKLTQHDVEESIACVQACFAEAAECELKPLIQSKSELGFERVDHFLHPHRNVRALHIA